MLNLSIVPVQVKIALMTAVAVIVLGLTFGAVHYHSAWVKSQQEVAGLQEKYSQLKSISEACSNGVEELRKAADKKEEAAKKAMAKASASAKVNEEKGQTILISKPKSSDSCRAAVKLYQEYKATK